MIGTTAHEPDLAFDSSETNVTWRANYNVRAIESTSPVWFVLSAHNTVSGTSATDDVFALIKRATYLAHRTCRQVTLHSTSSIASGKACCIATPVADGSLVSARQTSRKGQADNRCQYSI